MSSNTGSSSFKKQSYKSIRSSRGTAAPNSNPSSSYLALEQHRKLRREEEMNSEKPSATAAGSTKVKSRPRHGMESNRSQSHAGSRKGDKEAALLPQHVKAGAAAAHQATTTTATPRPRSRPLVTTRRVSSKPTAVKSHYSHFVPPRSRIPTKNTIAPTGTGHKEPDGQAEFGSNSENEFVAESQMEHKTGLGIKAIENEIETPIQASKINAETQQGTQDATESHTGVLLGLEEPEEYDNYDYDTEDEFVSTQITAEDKLEEAYFQHHDDSIESTLASAECGYDDGNNNDNNTDDDFVSAQITDDEVDEENHEGGEMKMQNANPTSSDNDVFEDASDLSISQPDLQTVQEGEIDDIEPGEVLSEHFGMLGSLEDDLTTRSKSLTMSLLTKKEDFLEILDSIRKNSISFMEEALPLPTTLQESPLSTQVLPSSSDVIEEQQVAEVEVDHALDHDNLESPPDSDPTTAAAAAPAVEAELSEPLPWEVASQEHRDEWYLLRKGVSKDSIVAESGEDTTTGSSSLPTEEVKSNMLDLDGLEGLDNNMNSGSPDVDHLDQDQEKSTVSAPLPSPPEPEQLPEKEVNVNSGGELGLDAIEPPNFYSSLSDMALTGTGIPSKPLEILDPIKTLRINRISLLDNRNSFLDTLSSIFSSAFKKPDSTDNAILSHNIYQEDGFYKSNVPLFTVYQTGKSLKEFDGITMDADAGYGVNFTLKYNAQPGIAFGGRSSLESGSGSSNMVTMECQECGAPDCTLHSATISTTSADGVVKKLGSANFLTCDQQHPVLILQNNETGERFTLRRNKDKGQDQMADFLIFPALGLAPGEAYPANETDTSKDGSWVGSISRKLTLGNIYLQPTITLGPAVSFQSVDLSSKSNGSDSDSNADSKPVYLKFNGALTAETKVLLLAGTLLLTNDIRIQDEDQDKDK